MTRYLYKSERVDSLATYKLGLKELAHELKLPLFNIKSFLETLYEHNFKLTDVQRLDFLETANKETDRLLFLIENIIELESIPSSTSLIKDGFPVSDLLLQVINSYKLMAKNKPLHLLYKYTRYATFVYGNSNLISQVIYNLVGNSFKYSFNNKRVYIRTRLFTSVNTLGFKKQEKLNFSILDEGIGISRRELSLIFLGELSKRPTNFRLKIKGNNLGLKIVRQILSAHNTPLLCLSVLDKGSIIGFSLFSTSYIAGKGT